MAKRPSSETDMQRKINAENIAKTAEQQLLAAIANNQFRREQKKNLTKKKR